MCVLNSVAERVTVLWCIHMGRVYNVQGWCSVYGECVKTLMACEPQFLAAYCAVVEVVLSLALSGGWTNCM